MSNRCRRCNRKLSNAEALYGWRCAEILGIAETATNLSYDNFVKLVDGVLKADGLFKNSNIEITDAQMKAIYAASIESELFEKTDANSLSKEIELILEKYVKTQDLKERIEKFSEDFKKFVNDIPEKIDGAVDVVSGKISGAIDSITKKVKETVDGISKEVQKYGEDLKTGEAFDPYSEELAKAGMLDEVSAILLKAEDLMSLKKAAVLDKNGNLIENSANKQGVENYKRNSEIDMSEYKEYINGQKIGNVAEFKFGNTTMDENGCEVIATYNALVTLGAKEDLCKIAAHYESDGQMLNGTWGTNPYAAERFFKQRGYEVSKVEGDDILNDKIPDADAYILSFWNSDKVSESLHTVAVRKTEIGKYVIYNYKGKKNRQENTDGIKIFAEEGVQPIVLFTINKK